jgi:hypothetical protein
MFSKILNKLFSSSKKDLRPNASESYIELRDMLREILLPLGFDADEQDIGIGEIATYKRETLRVVLSFDKRDWLFQFFASNDESNPIPSSPQVSMTFSPNYYTDEQKNALRSKLEEWLKTLEQK